MTVPNSTIRSDRQALRVSAAECVEAFCRVMPSRDSKLVVTSCQRNFGPQVTRIRGFDLSRDLVQASGAALKLLLAEAGLILGECPDQETELGIDPAILVSDRQGFTSKP